MIEIIQAVRNRLDKGVRGIVSVFLCLLFKIGICRLERVLLRKVLIGEFVRRIARDETDELDRGIALLVARLVDQTVVGDELGDEVHALRKALFGECLQILRHDLRIHRLIGAEGLVVHGVHRRTREIVLRVGDVHTVGVLYAQRGDVDVLCVHALRGIGQRNGGYVVFLHILPRLFHIRLDPLVRLHVEIIEEHVGIETVLIERLVVFVEHLLRGIELALIEEPLVEEYALRVIFLGDGHVAHLKGDGDLRALARDGHGDAARIHACRLFCGNVETHIQSLIFALGNDVLACVADVFVGHERIGILSCGHASEGL